MEYSLILSGAMSCVCHCHYCSADIIEPTANYKDTDYIEIDYVAMEKTLRSNPLIQNAIKNREPIQLNLWGSEPLMWIDYYDEIMEWYETVMTDLWKFDDKSKPVYYISTSGIPLKQKKVRDWIDHQVERGVNLSIQLSHDGVGQFCRTGKWDPLYDEEVGPYLADLCKKGIFNMINATLHKFNNSHMANIFYFNKWRYENHLENSQLMIKNNHMNDSAYCDDFNLRGDSLREYMHEMELVWQQAYLADNNDLWWKPYREYYLNQMKRWDKYNGPGGCGMFSTGMRDYTWCMNSKGEYVMCQLFQSNEFIPNKDLKRKPVYEEGKYSSYNEMWPCPDMEMSESPDYKEEYIRCVLRLKNFIRIVDELKRRGEVETPPQCNGNNCQKPKRVIYTGDIEPRILEY